MIPDRIEPTHDELVMQFAANCVQWAADAADTDYLTMFHRMDRVGMIESYLMEFYDVLHCESRQNITKDVLEALLIREGKLKESCDGDS